MTNNLLTEKKIKYGLETKFIAKNLYYYPEISSTNKAAAQLASEGEQEGTVVIAEKQTGGKGRRGREWHSPPGTGLWFSIILKPEIKVAESHFLTINASLAVFKALQKRGFEIDIKWPNDILYKNRKVCGILSEMSASSKKLKYAITGIGINVNQNKFPKEIKNKAISLYKIRKEKVDRLGLLQDILLYFEHFYIRFINGEKDMLLEEWKDKIALLDKEITVKSDGKVYKGKAIDIAKDGRLILKTEDSGLIKFWAGDTSIKK